MTTQAQEAHTILLKVQSVRLTHVRLATGGGKDCLHGDRALRAGFRACEGKVLVSLERQQLGKSGVHGYDVSGFQDQIIGWPDESLPTSHQPDDRYAWPIEDANGGQLTTSPWR